MMDEREDRLDALLREAAQDYNAPPAAPRQEMWERIAAVRQRDGGTEGQRDRGTEQSDGVIRFQPSHRPTVQPSPRPAVRIAIGIAALLALGVAIGRFTAPSTPGTPTATGIAAETGTRTQPAESLGAGATAPRHDKSELVAQLATVQHLGQVETFLTEFNTGKAAQDFTAQAQDLLSTTRLLLDSKRLTDARTRKLLEDLELVLVQIATLNSKDRREDLDFIADGLAQSHLRARIRNAIPTGPVIRM